MPFKARLITLCLFSALVFLAGCEERVDPVYGATSFVLVSPTENSNVSDTEGNIKVKYTGSVNLSNILLELNGTDITDKFVINNVSDQAQVPMADVRNALVQGDNYLLAAQILLDANDDPVLDDNGRPVLVTSQTFRFFLDDIAPRLTINTVTPDIANADGSPQAGSTIVVEGDLIDVSNIASLVFTYPGGTRTLLLSSSDPLTGNQYSNGTKKYRVSLPAYPDTSTASSTPHFSYTITDSVGHSRTERFMASGTPIVAKGALQINDSLTWNIAPLANAFVKNGFEAANAGNLFGLGAPRRLGTTTEPSPNDLIEDPLINCQPSLDIPGVKECRPYGVTRIFVYPSNSTVCGSMLFKQSAGVTDCVVFIKGVQLDNPNVDVDFSETSTNGLILTLEMAIKHAAVDIEVAGIRVEGIPPFHDTRYLGGLKGRAAMSRFSVKSDIKIEVDSNLLFKATRITPFTLHLTDLLQVPALSGTCNICSNLVSPLTMIILAIGTDINGNGTVDKDELINKLSEAIENKAGQYVDDALAGLQFSSTRVIENDLADKQIISNLSVAQRRVVYENNAHFVLNGSDRVDPAFYTPDYLAVNGGLGSLFAPQGSYYNNLPTIKGWGITSQGEKVIDLSFAVSANSVNQWLLANHQTGMLSEYGVGMTGADIAAANLDNIDPTDELRLTLETGEAPSVVFTSQDRSSGSACLGSLCAFETQATPGSIKLAMNRLDIHLDNVTDAVPVIDANIDLVLEVELRLAGGSPSITLKQNSLRVNVNSVTVPSGSASNAMISSALGKGIENFMSSPAFAALFGQRTDPVILSLSDIPNIGTCLPATTSGHICGGGQEIPYSDLFESPKDIPRDFAVLFRWLTIAPGGSYLSVGLDVRNKIPSAWTPQQLSENFMTFRVTP